MIIPVRCFTCGKTLADKYDYYLTEVAQMKKDAEAAAPAAPAPAPGFAHFEKIHTGPIMDRLGLTRYCCRRHMLTTVDMMEIIS